MSVRAGLPGSGPAPASPALSDRDLIDLQQLAGLYWALADGTEPIAVRDLFVEDGVLELGALRLEGADAIDAFFREREAEQRESGRTTRHFATGFLALPLGPDMARIRSNVMVFSGSGELPLVVGLPSGIADFEDACVRSPSGRWRYRRRVGRTVFIGEGAPRFAR